MIYIVEDDINIREMESYALKNSGFSVVGFSGSEGDFRLGQRGGVKAARRG